MPAPEPSAAAEVRSEHSADFLRLRQLWLKREQFSLMFAAVDNPDYRDGLIDRLDALRPGLRVQLEPGATPEAWLQQLQAATQTGARRLHCVLPDSLALTADARKHWWQRANLLRERLAEAFPAPLLLWMSDADIDRAAHQAPDLWNWREAVFSFTQPTPLSLPDQPSPRYTPLSDTDAQAVQQRLKDIEHYLQQHADDDSLTAAHLLLETSQAQQRLGLWADSETAARQAARAFAQAGNAQLTAVAQGQVADIRQARRQLDEALRIRNEEELPVYERLGDVREKAVTLGKIAMIDALQGRTALAVERSTAAQQLFAQLGLPAERAWIEQLLAALAQPR